MMRWRVKFDRRGSVVSVEVFGRAKYPSPRWIHPHLFVYATDELGAFAAARAWYDKNKPSHSRT